MAFKGYGVARVEGRVVFIPYRVTGDEARIEIVEEKKNYSLGRLEASFVLPPGERAPLPLLSEGAVAASGSTSRSSNRPK